MKIGKFPEPILIHYLPNRFELLRCTIFEAVTVLRLPILGIVGYIQAVEPDLTADGHCQRVSGLRNCHSVTVI